MIIKDNKITKSEKIYQFNESEYKSLLNESKNYGAEKTKEYIGFCWNNYIWEKNVGGAVEFINDLMRFLECRSDYIDNTYGLSFWSWLRENK